MKIGFIGAGKVGFTLGKYISIRRLPLMGYYSHTPESAKSAASFTGSTFYFSIKTLIEECELIFITVPDSAIEQVWEQIKELPVKGKIFCHCSGLLSSTLFLGIEQREAYGYSLHPLSAINDKYHSVETLSDVYFTLEGSPKKLNEMTNFVRSLGNPVQIIKADEKCLYHTACVILSNLTVALTKVGSDLLTQSGLSAEFAEKAWHKLFLGNANNICQAGIFNALTGPLERNDVQSIQKHIHCLEGNSRDIYINLSKVLLDIAKQKHPQRDYTLIETELNQ